MKESIKTNMKVLNIGDNCRICNTILTENPQKGHIFPQALTKHIRQENTLDIVSFNKNADNKISHYKLGGSGIAFGQLWCHDCEANFGKKNDAPFVTYFKTIDTDKTTWLDNNYGFIPLSSEDYNLIKKFSNSVLKRHFICNNLDNYQEFNDVIITINIHTKYGINGAIDCVPFVHNLTSLILSKGLTISFVNHVDDDAKKIISVIKDSEDDIRLQRLQIIASKQTEEDFNKINNKYN